MAKRKTTTTEKPVWSAGIKGGASRADAELCLAYCAGRDVRARPPADAVLIPYDLWTNRAHCTMLCRRGIIGARELAAIEKGLARIERDAARGRFQLDPKLEDVHINLERAVAKISGERPAGVMHTARSRNDQTATDVRLWLRDQLLRLTDAVVDTTIALGEQAAHHAETVMAGWTHGQPAMPTTLGHWAAAHAQALMRDLEALTGLWARINRSPLGAAAGFGSGWPIDREMSAGFLGFAAVQVNSLDCVATRWESEARLGSILSILMTHLSSLGQDLIYLSSPPRRLVRLDPAFTTGSSIMPQKRNPDFAEVTRARAAAVHGLTGALLGVGRGALSGYNRDTQWTKYWIMDLIDEVGAAPEVLARVAATMKPDAAALAETARGDFIAAVDLADFIASSRAVEFRRVYHLVAEAVAADFEKGGFRLDTVNRLLKKEKIKPLDEDELLQALDASRAVAHRQSLGAPAPGDVRAQVQELLRFAREKKQWAAAKRESLEKAKADLSKTLAELTAKTAKA